MAECFVCGAHCLGDSAYTAGYCSYCRKEIFPDEHPLWSRRRTVEKYGLSFDDYVRMYENQSGKCKICGSEIALFMVEGGPEIANVDHDHDTGNVRGLLCRNCNHGLGNFKDSEENLLSAIKYLSK